MGNSNDHERVEKERERELQLRSSRLEAYRFEKLKKLLRYIKINVPIDDFSNDAVNQRMNHYFQDSSRTSSNLLKSSVSKKKVRFQNDVFNLDLAYITKRVIAMGYPSKGIESIYRNSRSETISFMNTYHSTHYRIYNLCAEVNRYYRASTFNNAVSYFPMKDHNPTDLIMMLEFCIDAYLYLAQHENNVIAVHCKAGKGRTGLMICAYLVFTQAYNDKQAIQVYGQRRTYNGKGLTIKSQIRYVSYFWKFLKDNLVDNFIEKLPTLVKSHSALSKLKKKLSNKITLTALNIGPFKTDMIAEIKISKLDDSVSFCESIYSTRFNFESLVFMFSEEVVEEQDILVSFKGPDIKFSFWVNTYFFYNCDKFSRQVPRISKYEQFGTELNRDELDKLKSKSTEDFSVIIMGYKQYSI